MFLALKSEQIKGALKVLTISNTHYVNLRDLSACLLVTGYNNSIITYKKAERHINHFNKKDNVNLKNQ